MLLRVSAALIALSALAMPADVATFHTTVSLVKADAYVYDRQTRAPILDLQASDFTIFDEDQPRDIAFFGNDSGPVDLLLLLDISGSIRDILPQIAYSATGALSVLQEGDRSGVMAFTKTTAVTQPLTGDFNVVARGIHDAMKLRIGLDTDINQALWSAADYMHGSGGQARRAILIITDNMQETRVPDSLVDEQLSEAGAVLDGLLLRGPLGLPHVTHPGILGFARNSGGEVIEGNHPAGQLGEMIRRIKFRYSIHFRPVETKSPQPRKIHIELSAEARRRYPNAVIRARRIYFPFATYRPKPEILPGQRIATKAPSSLHQGSCRAGAGARRACQRGRARFRLDAADFLHHAPGEGEAFRPATSHGPSRAARGTGAGICFLAAPQESSHITGSVLNLTGGKMLP